MGVANIMDPLQKELERMMKEKKQDKRVHDRDLA